MEDLKFELEPKEKYIGILHEVISAIKKWDYFAEISISQHGVITLYRDAFVALFGTDVKSEPMATEGWWYYFTEFDGVRIECVSKEDPKEFRRKD